MKFSWSSTYLSTNLGLVLQNWSTEYKHPTLIAQTRQDIYLRLARNILSYGFSCVHWYINTQKRCVLYTIFLVEHVFAPILRLCLRDVAMTSLSVICNKSSSWQVWESFTSTGVLHSFTTIVVLNKFGRYYHAAVFALCGWNAFFGCLTR